MDLDCRTARRLLDFARPGGYDLVDEDRSALERHLANCSDCDAAARGGRQLDEHLGRAVRDVTHLAAARSAVDRIGAGASLGRHEQVARSHAGGAKRAGSEAKHQVVARMRIARRPPVGHQRAAPAGRHECLAFDPDVPAVRQA